MRNFCSSPIPTQTIVSGTKATTGMDKLDPADRQKFAALPLGPATLSPAELGPVLLEPHPSWMTRLEAEWRRRYAK